MLSIYICCILLHMLGFYTNRQIYTDRHIDTHTDRHPHQSTHRIPIPDSTKRRIFISSTVKSTFDLVGIIYLNLLDILFRSLSLLLFHLLHIWSMSQWNPGKIRNVFSLYPIYIGSIPNGTVKQIKQKISVCFLDKRKYYY